MGRGWKVFCRMIKEVITTNENGFMMSRFIMIFGATIIALITILLNILEIIEGPTYGITYLTGLSCLALLFIVAKAHESLKSMRGSNIAPERRLSIAYGKAFGKRYDDRGILITKGCRVYLRREGPESKGDYWIMLKVIKNRNPFDWLDMKGFKVKIERMNNPRSNPYVYNLDLRKGILNSYILDLGCEIKVLEDYEVSAYLI